MKTIFKIVAVVLFAGIFTACVQDDDYTVPTDLGQIENVNLTELTANSTELTIQQVKDLFVAGTASQIVSDVYVKGYVSSSDESGNFYKEFFIQDAPENPTAAIKVVVNASDLFARYNKGREVFINLKDMYVGETRSGDGVIAIGELPNVAGDEVEAFRENMAIARILRSTTTATIVPMVLKFNEINTNHIGMFIQVENVQFPTNLSGDLYVDPYDNFDTTRTMESCDGFGYSNFALETSTFANFKNIPLPLGGGTVSGVINNNYNGSNMVMVLNDVADVQMNNSRCTPLDINDFTLVFQETFDTGISAWTTQDIIGGQSWTQTTFGNPGPSAKMSGFSGGAQDNEDWLISPMIDLSTVTNSVVFFETVKRYNGLDLEVYMSTDYTGGNPNTSGTWTQLSVALDTNTGSWSSWTNSGTIDISSADGGNVYIAFKYISTTSGGAATFEVDNVNVLGL